MTDMSSLLLRRARVVPVTSPAPGGAVDLRIVDGRVAALGPQLTPARGERVVDAAGRWLMPGLWDQHVHTLQWAQLLVRLDTGATSGPAEVLHRVRLRLAAEPPGTDPGVPLVGWGHRIATWRETPTVAALDAVCGTRPVVLISGDAHHGWLSSAALRLLGLAPRAGIVCETEWFEAYARLGEWPDVRAQGEAAMADVVARAAALGVVGVTDFEFGGAYADWPERVARGVTGLRVRTATYAGGLDEVVAAGWRTGDALEASGQIRMGPLKIISDGSLSTYTAYCCEPYLGTGAEAHPFGVLNTPPEELNGLLARAAAAGLEVAVHAIGDAAVASALDGFAATGARGSIEHAQLVATADIPRMAELGLVASVQPAHLIADRDVADVCWADRTHRCFPFRAMTDAGIRLVLGSDAPVSPLDPWLEIATAVHRSGDERAPWHAEQSLTPAEALAASTNGQGTVEAGQLADLVLLDADPLGPGPRPPVAATLLGGRFTHTAW
ncbi:MAG: amidohydrolase family protein [Propionibacteriaceae bacterium]|nr:amidohydrolase family protein [Propionibacteriaceae bacterium]